MAWYAELVWCGACIRIEGAFATREQAADAGRTMLSGAAPGAWVDVYAV